MKQIINAVNCAGILCAMLFGVTVSSFSQELPVAAMNMLAEAKSETCVICQEKLRKKAFVILEKELQPGKTLTFSNSNCLVLKQGYASHLLKIQQIRSGSSDNEDIENRPEVTFRFHTEPNHCTGISRNDYTGGAVVEKLKRMRPGVSLHGTVRLIEFKYGDGTCFNFFPKRNEIIIHCRILSLD